MSNDGTTAVQVSPIPTEQDMNTFRAIMDRALNSIVQASELAKVVDGLKVEVEAFKQDMAILRKHNQDLDEMLSHVRGQRDQVQLELVNTRNERNQAETERDLTREEVLRLGRELAELKENFTKVSNDRDLAYREWDKADIAKGHAEAKLADLKAFAANAFGLTEAQPVPEPSPPLSEPMNLVTDTAGAKPEDAHSEQVQTQPSPSAEEWVTSDDPTFNWAQPYEWREGAYRQRKAA